MIAFGLLVAAIIYRGDRQQKSRPNLWLSLGRPVSQHIACNRL
ncbi:hypothetical protein [Schleiferilactobacillus harbinensis]